MAARRRFLAAAASAYCASAFGAYYISKRLRAGGADESSSSSSSSGRGDGGDGDLSSSPWSSSSSSVSTFSKLAPGYDRAIDTDETLMGLKLLRRFTLGGGGFLGSVGAEGDVLEACAGTGRNLAYYSRRSGVRSVTLADPSREMLAEARQKAIALSEKDGDGGGDFPRINFVLARAEGLVSRAGEEEKEEKEKVFGPDDAVDLSEPSSPPLLPPLPSPGRFAPRSFDTVVDTFGLCSVEDPKRALEEMAAACKPGGKIILIEHGRATTQGAAAKEEESPSGSSDSRSPFPFTKPWVDARLDASAAEHRRKWGCWWNRDLEAEIRGVVDVLSVDRWHFGTTLVVVARPRKAANEEG